ncbi:hypothetical protein [Candidatus Uabimicrobium amorphum]|uniref:DUF2225 domain-containing protein n=1 Tax=Uabimicrobium amorphum TaxID=2596890 RepID=A0A5S9IIT6_UABAM|nr:hypothetical protein [Candidatus Uabimicrobium amorphum]BBM82638.1 hypothetical protein UABAM_00981 [Candidatus Uabimicrobium amorphum]
MIRYFTLVILFCACFVQADWREKIATCPVCLKQTAFLQPASFSNEIYMRPSRFQYVFWPFTDTRSIYCCQKCSYSTFSWHFHALPANKLIAVTDALKEMNHDLSKYEDYTAIPISTRMRIAEKVYEVWGLGHDHFWAEFYRTKAYHLEKEADNSKNKKKALERKQPQVLEKRKHPGATRSILSAVFYPVLKFLITQQTKDFLQHYRHQQMSEEQDILYKEATEDRKKALAIAEEVLKQPQQDFFPHKECYFIAGAMSYLIKDYKKAKKHFNDGLKIDYTTKQMSAEEAQEYNKYLNKLLQEYLKKLE